MAKKQNLTVVTDFGTFTRTTARDYAFVVACRGRKHETIEREYANNRASQTDNVAYLRRKLAGTERIYDWETRAEVEQSLAASEAWLAGGGELARQADIAAADAALLAPFGEKACTWSSRLDLARKQAAKDREWYRDVRIFDVATGQEVK
jgi:hypothetical protein